MVLRIMAPRLQSDRVLKEVFQKLKNLRSAPMIYLMHPLLETAVRRLFVERASLGSFVALSQ